MVDGGLDALALTLTAGVRAAIDAHVKLLLAWNDAINLTALRTPDAIARGHVLDSLSAANPIRRLLSMRRRGAAHTSLLDLGSGGGYPGLPLGLALGVGRLALVDSVQKKARFLQVAADAAAAALIAAGESAPQVDVLAERSEDIADEADHRAGWDLVVARAVGSLAEVAELGLPLAAVRGHVIAWKRDDGSGTLDAELRAAARVIQAAGGGRPHIQRVDPDGMAGLASHVLVVIGKVRPTPDRYPRQPAERKRAPLLR